MNDCKGYYCIGFVTVTSSLELDVAERWHYLPHIQNAREKEQIESYFEPIIVSNTGISILLLDRPFEMNNYIGKKCNNNIWTIFKSKFELQQFIIIISEVDHKEPHALIGQQVGLKSFFFFN